MRIAEMKTPVAASLNTKKPLISASLHTQEANVERVTARKQRPILEKKPGKPASKVKEEHLDYHSGSPKKKGERGEEIKELEKHGKFLVTCIHCNPKRLIKGKEKTWFIFKGDGLTNHYTTCHPNAADKDACKHCGNKYNETRKSKHKKTEILVTHEDNCLTEGWVQYFRDEEISQIWGKTKLE